MRELENIIERGVIFCSGDSLTLSDLGLCDPEKSSLPGLNPDVCLEKPLMSFKDAKEENIRLFHEHYIRALLRNNQGNISRAAGTAGIQRQYLHRLMKESHIDANEFRGVSPVK